MKILAERNNYYIWDITSGPLLFKLPMQRDILEIRATDAVIQDNFHSLGALISSIKSNLKKFNEYVKLNYGGLKSHSESCDYLMAKLFQGYRTDYDCGFVQHIQMKKYGYYD